jgi:hypothetical protein
MRRPRRFVETEVSASFRRDPVGTVCAFVSTIETDSEGQRSARASKHLHASPERLVDLAVAEVREQLLEHFLANQEPF